MFKNLSDFSYKRNWKEAIGFYVVYFFVGVLLGAVAGGVYGAVSGVEPEGAFQAGQRVGVVVAVIYDLVLSFVVLQKKDLLSNIGYIVVGLLAGALSLFGGALLGLIPVAYLTTVGEKKEEEGKESIVNPSEETKIQNNTLQTDQNQKEQVS